MNRRAENICFNLLLVIFFFVGALFDLPVALAIWLCFSIVFWFVRLPLP